MSEKKMGPATPARPDPEELVEYTAPIGTGVNERDITVGVNGKLMRIRRGETVQIPRKYLDVIQNANQQHIAAEKYMRQLQQRKGPIASL